MQQQRAAAVAGGGGSDRGRHGGDLEEGGGRSPSARPAAAAVGGAGVSAGAGGGPGPADGDGLSHPSTSSSSQQQQQQEQKQQPPPQQGEGQRGGRGNGSGRGREAGDGAPATPEELNGAESFLPQRPAEGSLALGAAKTEETASHGAVPGNSRVGEGGRVDAATLSEAAYYCRYAFAACRPLLGRVVCMLCACRSLLGCAVCVGGVGYGCFVRLCRTYLCWRLLRCCLGPVDVSVMWQRSGA